MAIKKISAFLLILFALISVTGLAGCGGSDGPSNDYYYVPTSPLPPPSPQPSPSSGPPSIIPVFPSPSDPAVHPTLFTGKVYGLFIGITEYQNVSKLNFCVSDSNVIETALSNGIANSIWSSAEYIVCNNSTKNEIVNAINTIISKMTPNDAFFMFYSGHGASVGNPTPESEAYICPVDSQLNDVSTMISSQELRDLLLKMPPDSFKILCFDCCHSGGFIGKNAGLTPKGLTIPRQPGMIENGGFKTIGNTIQNVSFITASQYNELSYETESLQHGILTYYVWKALGENGNVFGKAFTNTSQLLTAEQIYSFVQKGLLLSDINEQHPQYYTSAPTFNPVLKGNK